MRKGVLEMYTNLESLITSILSEHRTWRLKPFINKDLEVLCDLATQLIDQWDSYAYEIEINDTSGILSFSFEDYYASIDLGSDSPLIKFLKLCNSFKVTRLDSGLCKIQFNMYPLFDID